MVTEQQILDRLAEIRVERLVWEELGKFLRGRAGDVELPKEAGGPEHKEGE